MKEAKEQGIAVAENNHPEWGIAYSLQCGLKKCLEQKPDVKKILFVVGDQPYLTAETLRRLMGVSVQYPGKIICAGTHGRPGESGAVGSEIFSGASEIRRGHRWQADYEKISG